MSYTEPKDLDVVQIEGAIALEFIKGNGLPVLGFVGGKMSYRPNGWEETKMKLLSDLMLYKEPPNIDVVIERFADALLEALKKEGYVVSINQLGVPSLLPLFKAHANKKGTIVFIPEED